ncbi:MAG: hypothetical protein JNM56_10725 [Planctomycetia bacterium]|nr:hypothetical protein [Planctomycetia bacterium]
METTTPEIRCLHCDSNLSCTDIAEGWCNGCGKRLPSTVQAPKAGKSGYCATLPAGDAENQGLDLNRVLCGSTIVVLSCLLAGVFLFNMF